MASTRSNGWSGRLELNQRHLGSKTENSDQAELLPEVWRCESDLNRHLLDRQSSALPLSYRTGSGKRLLPAACQMSLTRRLLDGKSGGRLHANAPSFYTITFACEAHTIALSVVSHD